MIDTWQAQFRHGKTVPGCLASSREEAGKMRRCEVSIEEITEAIHVLMRMRLRELELLSDMDMDEEEEQAIALEVTEKRAMLKKCAEYLQAQLDDVIQAPEGV